jgi:hypothetical protein
VHVVENWNLSNPQATAFRLSPHAPHSAINKHL